MRVRMIQYGPSLGARDLSTALGVKRVLSEGSKFRARDDDIIINWGCSDVPGNWPWFITPDRPSDAQPVGKFINHPDAVQTASSKKGSLAVMQRGGVNVPEYTTDYNTAQEWARTGSRVVCRQLDRASGGRGIILAGGKRNENVELPKCGLYTLYTPKRAEYRVHICRGEVIDVQQKKLRKDFPEDKRDLQIRNFDRGWVFARQDISPPDVVLGQAQLAVGSLGLDFGAVDIGFTEKTSTACVYEVNTAPGLEGTTLQRYADALRKVIGG